MIYKVKRVRDINFPLLARGDLALVVEDASGRLIEVIDSGSESFCNALLKVREARDKIRSVRLL